MAAPTDGTYRHEEEEEEQLILETELPGQTREEEEGADSLQEEGGIHFI
jgi:hypothetical protein